MARWQVADAIVPADPPLGSQGGGGQLQASSDPHLRVSSFHVSREPSSQMEAVFHFSDGRTQVMFRDRRQVVVAPGSALLCCSPSRAPQCCAAVEQVQGEQLRRAAGVALQVARRHAAMQP